LSACKTYAAVAANISTLLALVATARHDENSNVNVHIRPSLALKSVTKERAMIDVKGANDDNIVPKILVTSWTCFVS
jgi:hypothetical protein